MSNLTTDSKGIFYQGLLSPGFYQISITVSGFRPRLLRREIRVSLTGEVVPVPVSLEPETPTTTSTQPSPAILEESDNIRVEINTTDARRDGSFKADELSKQAIGAFIFGSQRILFCTDIFNFINRANFGIPVRLLEAPGFGKAIGTVTPGRRVQFSLKFI